MKKQALLWKQIDEKKVHCFLCAHECLIPESKLGICGVRQNIEGILHTLVYAEVIAANVDPIEKKPLYHFLPDSMSFSVATIGCNFKCEFCQNWRFSQASAKNAGIGSGYTMTPKEVVEEAKKHNCSSISYTYTEPTTFFEYAYDTAELAKEADLRNIFVTNGFMTTQALKTIKPLFDAANIDLKSFSDDYYKKTCKGRLKPVLDNITSMKEMGIWVEVTTLVIPGRNDSDEELGQIAEFLANIDKNIPWHLSRFHPDYKLQNQIATPVETLRRAREIGRSKGLRYIYLGNIPEVRNTYCFNCNDLLTRRTYMGVEYQNIKNGLCPSCGSKISGVWE